MAVTCFVVVLEGWLQVNPSDLNGTTVLIKYGGKFTLFSSVCSLQILSASKQSVVLSNGWHFYGGLLVYTFGSECAVDVSAECSVVEESFRVVSLISRCKGIILLLSKVKV